MVDRMSLGDRMKQNYEGRTNISLIRRMPVIIRLDGRAFHTLTHRCEKPFDVKLADCMKDVTMFLCEEIQGAKLAYTQSDEISILLTDYDTLETQAWFDNNIQKMVSISAGLASAKFTTLYGKFACFDSRAFNIPKEEVCNYFIWRQKDWRRNSVQMLAQSLFSPKQLNCKDQTDMLEMTYDKGHDWEKLEPRWKNGLSFYRTPSVEDEYEWWSDSNLIFTENRGIVEERLEFNEVKSEGRN